ncbi:MAG: GH36 C-terminal domain-containing protein, partial [Mucilaginibacter sp.]
MYVNPAKTSAIMFNYLVSPRYHAGSSAIKLKGLNPDKMYTLSELNVFPG